MSTIKKVRTQCLDCKRETNHEIVATKLYENFIPNEYYDGKEYSIVQCLGCDQVSFLKTYHDYEAIYPTGYDNDYEHARSYTNYYPDASEVLVKFKRLLPRKLYEIYSETKVAFTQNLFIFTAIGIRAIIECICKDKSVIGRNLEKKITNLKTMGDISKRDIDLLHSLRFLGNEAAHELTKPENTDIKVAFNIIEHLIQSIYIMPKEIKHTNFKEHLDEYNKFENFIIETIKEHPSFDYTHSYSIKKLISPKGKIPIDKFNEFEQKLNTRIDNDELDWIERSTNINPNEVNQDASENYYKIKKFPELF